jgi:hypothetical protein
MFVPAVLWFNAVVKAANSGEIDKVTAFLSMESLTGAPPPRG